MSYTKRQIIDESFGELALAGYTFDITPEEQESALKRLDMMLAVWNARGIEVGYQFGEVPAETDLDNDSGLPLFAVQAVMLKLAIEIAAGKGKQLSPSTKTTAHSAFNGMLAGLAREKCIQVIPRDNLPPSAGNRRRRFIHRPGFESEQCT